jgi:hypothetical protein
MREEEWIPVFTGMTDREAGMKGCRGESDKNGHKD